MPANTRALGNIVSKLPLGICSTTEYELGITETRRAPLSTLLQRSSVSGSSGGTCKSTSVSIAILAESVDRRTSNFRHVDEFQEMVCCSYKEV